MKKSVQFLLIILMLAGMAVSFAAGRASADQPYMVGALADLKAARDDLWNAKPNKGGHRERALNYVNSAINEVQMGIQFAE